MDLDQAINKHVEWKVKLRTAIAKQEKLDQATIARDDCCDLGRWLYGEARAKYATLPAYTACVEKDRTFHREAGKVAETINAGLFTQAEAMLGVGTPYSQASNETCSAIRALKKDARVTAGA